jgi:hypothetical protein
MIERKGGYEHKANRIKPQEDREPSSVLTSAMAPSKILPAQSTLRSLCRSSNPKYNRNSLANADAKRLYHMQSYRIRAVLQLLTEKK